MTVRTIALPALALALLAAACAKQGNEAGGGPTVGGSSASSATGTASSTASASGTSSPTAAASPLIEDGRNFAFIKSVDVSADPPTITYDLAYFLTGDAATQAAKDHGDEAPPPNDYYIVNDNRRLRTVPLASGARLVLLDWNHCCDVTFDGDLTAFAEAINSGKDVTVGDETYKGGSSPYWLVARNGRILRVEEQFLP
jgi:hypothetical protein